MEGEGEMVFIVLCERVISLFSPFVPLLDYVGFFLAEDGHIG